MSFALAHVTILLLYAFLVVIAFGIDLVTSCVCLKFSVLFSFVLRFVIMSEFHVVTYFLFLLFVLF